MHAIIIFLSESWMWQRQQLLLVVIFGFESVEPPNPPAVEDDIHGEA